MILEWKWEWDGMGWNGKKRGWKEIEWNGMEWNGLRIGMEFNDSMTTMNVSQQNKCTPESRNCCNCCLGMNSHGGVDEDVSWWFDGVCLEYHIGAVRCGAVIVHLNLFFLTSPLTIRPSEDFISGRDGGGRGYLQCDKLSFSIDGFWSQWCGRWCGAVRASSINFTDTL